MRPTIFTIETVEGQSFEGFTNGETWNGWACPYFTHEQAQTLVEVWRSAGYVARYDEAQDAFLFANEPPSDETEFEDFPAEEVKGQRYYAIGAGCWIWQETESLSHEVTMAN